MQEERPEDEDLKSDNARRCTGWMGTLSREFEARNLENHPESSRI